MERTVNRSPTVKLLGAAQASVIARALLRASKASNIGNSSDTDNRNVLPIMADWDRWVNLSTNDGAPYLCSGWYSQEAWGVWGQGGTHVLRIAIVSVPDNGAVLEASVQAFLPPAKAKQLVDVWSEGKLLETWKFTPTHNLDSRQVRLPPTLFTRAADHVELCMVFRPRWLASPHRYHPESTDYRELGFGISSFRLAKSPGRMSLAALWRIHPIRIFKNAQAGFIQKSKP